jgi:hypothetical protein
LDWASTSKRALELLRVAAAHIMQRHQRTILPMMSTNNMREVAVALALALAD